MHGPEDGLGEYEFTFDPDSWRDEENTGDGDVGPEGSIMERIDDND